MKKKHKIALILLLSIVIIGAVFYSGMAFSQYYKEKVETTLYPLKDPVSVINETYEREKMIIDYIFDVTDKEKMAGFSDYVFVAEVNSVKGTRYADAYYDDFMWLHADPYTEYEVTVRENLKGDLTLNEPITVFKGEGVRLHSKIVTLYMGDMLPLEGHCYLFLASMGEGRNIYTEGDHGNDYLCPIGELDTSENAKAVIQRYRQAVENMDESV